MRWLIAMFKLVSQKFNPIYTLHCKSGWRNNAFCMHYAMHAEHEACLLKLRVKFSPLSKSFAFHGLSMAKIYMNKVYDFSGWKVCENFNFMLQHGRFCELLIERNNVELKMERIIKMKYFIPFHSQAFSNRSIATENLINRAQYILNTNHKIMNMLKCTKEGNFYRRFRFITHA